MKLDRKLWSLGRWVQKEYNEKKKKQTHRKVINKKIRNSLLVSIIGLCTLGSSVALAAPSYVGGCARTDGWMSAEVYYKVYGSYWSYARLTRPGSYYGPWRGLGYYGSGNWWSQAVGSGGPAWTGWAEVQYAVGNNSGWAYGHVSWVWMPNGNGSPCG